jgi:anti-sigma regulatory factor (Ser/Thr protein kinase)
MSAEAMLQMELRSDPCMLAEARLRMREWLLAQAWEAHQAGELELALDEALANVIRHGYGGATDQAIQVCARTIEDEQLGVGVEVRVRDFGRQVEPGEICGRDLDDVRPGGLGVHIIRTMSSSVEYQRADGGGMLLIMTKYKTHHAHGPAAAEEQ